MYFIGGLYGGPPNVWFLDLFPVCFLCSHVSNRKVNQIVISITPCVRRYLVNLHGMHVVPSTKRITKCMLVCDRC